MTHDDLARHLAHFVSQGISVPQQAFEIAQTVDLSRFAQTSPREAAVIVLRMGLQRRFNFLAVRPSLLERVAPVQRSSASSRDLVAGQRMTQQKGTGAATNGHGLRGCR